MDETQVPAEEGAADPDSDERHVGNLRALSWSDRDVRDRFAVENWLDLEISGDHEGLLLVPSEDFPSSSLCDLRMPIRLAHERNIAVHAQIGWNRVKPCIETERGTIDSGSLETGRKVRHVARILYEQIPEADGLFVSSSVRANAFYGNRICTHGEYGFLEMSKEFFHEFYERSAFSGDRYRLETHLDALTRLTQEAPRVRNDFATVCEDLTYRLLSNLSTETVELFGRRLMFGLDGSIPMQLAPRLFGWFLDPFRFVRLGSLFFEADAEDMLTQSLARSISKYSHHPVFVNDGDSWKRQHAEPANVAVILQSRPALMDPPEAVLPYLECLRSVLLALDREGFAYDFITPELMTTSEMTETGGFQRQEEEYHAAVYPWPTVHTGYQWRELNLFLQEQGRAVFCGPLPFCLSSGEMISEDDAKNVRDAHVDSVDEIISYLDSVNVPRTRPRHEESAPLICSVAID